MPSYRVEVPLPPRECSPNWHGHWATKAGAVKAYRRDCALCYALDRGVGNIPQTFTTPVTIHLDFYLYRPKLGGTMYFVPNGFYYPRDADNARASFKAAQDALTDAGLIPSDSRNWVRVGETRLHRTKPEHQGRASVIVTLQT